MSSRFINVNEKPVKKAVQMGKTSAIGSFQLFIGRSISSFILALSSIIVGIYILQGEYGLYVIAIVPATTFLLFQDWGVGSALTKKCANYRAEKKEGQLRSIIISGLVFETATGLTLTLLSFLTANFVASTIFNSPESASLIAFASITIFFGAIHVGSNSVFVGFERMKLSTISLIVSAIIKALLSSLLVYLGFGAFGAVIGYTFGSLAAGVTDISLLYFAIFRRLPSEKLNKVKLVQTLKPLLGYGIPLSISTIIGAVPLQLYYFIMASSVDMTLIGNFQIALNFHVLLSFFILPIFTVLFPAFSKLDPSRDKKLLKIVFESSVKYASLFLVPATIALMVLSAPLVGTIFGDKWPFASFFLTIYVSGELLVLLGNLSFNRLLYSTGDTTMLIKLNALKLCIGAPLSFYLIPNFGILGLIITAFIGTIPTVIIGVYWTWKHYETKANFRNSAKILLSSIISGLITFLFLNSFVADSWIMLLSGAILFLITYLICIPIVGAINSMDNRNLRVMFSEMGTISKVLTIPLIIIQKILNFREKYFKSFNEN